MRYFEIVIYDVIRLFTFLLFISEECCFYTDNVFPAALILEFVGSKFISYFNFRELDRFVFSFCEMIPICHPSQFAPMAVV